MSRFEGPRGTVFHYNADMKGGVQVSAPRGGHAITIPAEDVLAFVADIQESQEGPTFRSLVERLLKNASFYYTAIEIDTHDRTNPLDGESWEKEALALMAGIEPAGEKIRTSYVCHDHARAGDLPLVCVECSRPADAVRDEVVQ